MSKIGIINFNSTAWTQKMLDSKIITTLKMNVVFNNEEKEYDTSEELYEDILTEKKIPTTSLPATGYIVETYKKVLEKFEEVLVVTQDKNLSGAHQSAVLAKGMLEEEQQTKIHIVESRSFNISEAIICDKAIDLINNKIPLNNIISSLDALSKKITTFIFPGKLEYLQKSGRVTFTKMAIGKVLGLKVLIQHKEGIAEPIAKGRGFKKVLKEAKNEIDKYDVEEFYYSEILPDEEEKSLLKKTLGKGKEIVKSSPILLCHFGPQTLGVAIIGKKKDI